MLVQLMVMYQFVILYSRLSITVKFDIARLNKANLDPLLVCILRFILTCHHHMYGPCLQAKVAVIIICIFRWFGYCYGISATPCCMFFFFALYLFYEIHTSIPISFISVKQVILGHSDQMLLSFR